MPPRYDEHEWATRDVVWMAGFLALLLMAALNVFFLYVALVVLAGGLGWVVARVVARRRRERANADAPFWADKLG